MAQAVDLDSAKEDTGVSYLEMEQVEQMEREAAQNVQADIYFSDPPTNRPNSAGAYDLANSSGVYRISKSRAQGQTAPGNQNKSTGWTKPQMVIVTLILVTFSATMGVALFSLFNGKLYVWTYLVQEYHTL